MITAIAVIAYGEGTGSMRRDLHCSDLAVTAGITSYLVVAAFAPLIMAPISEQFGRRGMLLISSVIFTLCFLPQALADNIALVIVFRAVQGAAASAANR
jgi:MFS family permease